MSTVDKFFLVIAALIGIVNFVLLMIKFIVSIYFPFVEMDDRIKTKILFSETHEQRKYWIYERKRLFVSFIPFVGGFVASTMKNKYKKR